MLMTNIPDGISSNIKVNNVTLDTVESFTYLGAVVTNKGYHPEILDRIAKTPTRFMVR